MRSPNLSACIGLSLTGILAAFLYCCDKITEEKTYLGSQFGGTVIMVGES